MNNVVFNTLREFLCLKEEEQKFMILSENAFEVFKEDNIYSLKEILMLWRKIYDWQNEQHSYKLEIQDWNIIEQSIQKFNNKEISKTELLKRISASRNNIIKYQSKLSEGKKEKLEILSNAYNSFFIYSDSEKLYSFIFKSPQIKKIIINFLLS